MRLALLGLLLAALAAPMPATAATLSKSGATLTYTAGDGRANTVTFSVPDPNTPTTVRVSRGADGDAIQATGCAAAGADFTCTGITRLTVNAGDGDDTVTATAFTGIATLLGGAGNDTLRAGKGADTLDGGDGGDLLEGDAGADVLQAGPGDDTLAGGTGGDVLTGGPGIDKAFYDVLAPTPVPRVSLDGVADDGLPGENDNFGADIEDASVLGLGVVAPSASTLIGNALANTLETGPGNDTIVAGAGNDNVLAGEGDDAVDVRDGYADRVRCGAGADTVTADTLDVAGADCETVNAADVGNALEDRPPAIAWAGPRPGVRLSADVVTTLQASASDDRGVALVRFLDDDRVVCDDAVPPFTCGYQPRGADVGRNTLIAVAIDGAGQTASAPLAVLVGRFTPRLTLAVQRGFRARGRLVLPATVSAAEGCSGTVTVRARARGRTLATRRARVTRSCGYAVRIRLASRRGLRFSARFAGNAVMTPRAAPTAAPRRARSSRAR